MNNLQSTTTMPLQRAEGPVLGGERKPVYIWSMGSSFMPSFTDSIIIEAYLKRFKYSDCVKALKERIGKVIGVEAVKRRMMKPHFKEWVAQVAREKGLWEGWTKERWLVVMTDHLEGKKRLMDGDLYGMKLIAGVKGFDMPKVEMNVGAINVVQRNGRE